MNEFTYQAKVLYESGQSLEQVAKALNSSRAWVSRKLRQAGVPMRPKNGATWTVEGNVVSCCRRCNVMKNDMSVDQFKAHLLRIVTHLELNNAAK